MRDDFSKDFYKSILDNNPSGIIVCSEDFNIIYANESIKTLSGFSDEELINQPVCKFIVDENNKCPIHSFNKDQDNISEKGELKTKSGDQVFIKIDINQPSENIIISLSPLSESICLNQAHLDFVSTVSHELRTPLTSIKGFADTLLTSGDMLPKDHQHRFLGIIKNQIDRLTRLVENLLTVSRLESQKSKSILKAINFESFIEPVIQIIKGKFSEHTFITSSQENLPPIWADSDKLEQVMTNLIDNAAKYSQPNTNVTIKAFYLGNDSDSVRIQIIDEGIGIPDEHIDKIFSQFSRIDNPLTREVQGTGLGLYITKSLIENMQGKISVASSENGTIFTVDLPAATLEKQAGQKLTEDLNQ